MRIVEMERLMAYLAYGAFGVLLLGIILTILVGILLGLREAWRVWWRE